MTMPGSVILRLVNTRSASIIFAGFSFPFFHSFVVVGDSFHILI